MDIAAAPNKPRVPEPEPVLTATRLAHPAVNAMVTTALVEAQAPSQRSSQCSAQTGLALGAHAAGAAALARELASAAAKASTAYAPPMRSAARKALRAISSSSASACTGVKRERPSAQEAGATYAAATAHVKNVWRPYKCALCGCLFLLTVCRMIVPRRAV